jgi:hypothetical protein
MSGGMTGSGRGDRYMWRLQPVIDFHEEGRPLQFLDTPATPATVPLFVYHARFHNKSL